MYKILIHGIKDKYEYNELIKLFLKPGDFETLTDDDSDTIVNPDDSAVVFNEAGFKDKNQIKREIYMGLSQITGQRPPWGILTGVRPVKLAGEISDIKKLTDFYLMSGQKASLI